MQVIRLACRNHMLAIAQAHMMMQLIRKYNPSMVPELITLKNTEDGTVKDSLEGLQKALAEGACDLVVHDLKAIPLRENPAFPIVAVSSRLDARDAIVISKHRDEPDMSLPLGVSNERRRYQLTGLYPQWRTMPVVGDVPTRLAMLDQGTCGGIIISAASANLLNQSSRIYRTFSVRQLMPACRQGIIALQGRAGDYAGYLAQLHDVDCWDMALAEYGFAQAMGGALHTLMGANARIREDQLTVYGMMVDAKGKMWSGELTGRREDAVSIGAGLAAKLRLDAAGPRPKKERYKD